MALPGADDGAVRLRVVVQGAVQGVGFRPFVYRLAVGLGLRGWVSNTGHGVFIEVEGPPGSVESFLLRLEPERPPRAIVHSLEPTFLDPAGYPGFEIRESAGDASPTTLVLPDIATCDDCLREVRDPADRRYRYPFTNCTNCGPRYSIILALPYDRPSTTMRGFAMCPECSREYADPLDRRFHAQPNACPACGPRVALWDADGASMADDDDAIRAAEAALREGRVLAVKGLGGFHLMVDAARVNAVAALRERKHREEKPLAVMYPSLALARRDCEIGPMEARALVSPERPILLLRRSEAAVAQGRIAEGVAPRNPFLGVMLPYTPLHHLLLGDLGVPLVATSGNLSDEPICTDECEALRRLHGIADLFLVHDRPIARHVDDSVARVVLGREMVMRRARGYAPLPVRLPEPAPRVLAVGAHLKSAVATTVEDMVFVSQHIGDLETEEAYRAFRRVVADLASLYGDGQRMVACDLHPDYLSTAFAEATGLPRVSVQHHYAHALACMAENAVAPPALAVSWDGTGYGPDGTVWGGEFLAVDAAGYRRAAHLRTFRLPGGDAGAREPRRSAIGALHAILGDAWMERTDLPCVAAFAPAERALLATALCRGVNAPVTSSAGRLFDAVAALGGIAQVSGFEGQSAMRLELSIDESCGEAYPFALGDGGDPLVVDWEPIVRGVLADVADGAPLGHIAARFHNALVEAIAAVVERVGLERVVLTGGCFQNRYLTESAVCRLREAGFRPYWHQRVPPNDGGIALGQAVGAIQKLRKEK
ncbi:MAG: carbamoyltransferase HypF [Chthonomonadales bacterium]|nr:carbamoyltransferase HypF [Chthonomonadales bacterium]